MTEQPKEHLVPAKLFLIGARNRLYLWIAAFLLAAAPNFRTLIQPMISWHLDVGAAFRTLASIYLITALGYFEVYYIQKLVIPDRVARWGFAAFGWASVVGSAICCVTCWTVPPNYEVPLEFSWWATPALGMLVLNIIGEMFLAEELLRWKPVQEPA